MKLAAYLRVSTDRQAEQGFGLDVQESAVQAWAKANGHRIVGWFRDEGVSGSNGVETRDALPQALNAIHRGEAEGIVVYSLDRLARKLEHQEGILAHVWKDAGRVFSIGDGGEILEDDPDDPMRTAIRQMRGVFAQLERAMITKRMRDGKRQKRSQRGYVGDGSPPYGMISKDGELVKAPDEQKAIAMMKRLRRQGKSLREIGRALEEAGHKPPQTNRPGIRRRTQGTVPSGRWHPTTVSAILKREGVE